MTPTDIRVLRERGSGSEMEFREALGITTPCCVSCVQDEEYGPLVFVMYEADNGVWVEIETCCEHQQPIKDGLIAAGIPVR